MNSEFYMESFTKPGFSRIKGLWGVGGKEKKIIKLTWNFSAC